MKYIFSFLTVVFISVTAHADPNSLFIQDGTTRLRVQQELSHILSAPDLVITDYALAWEAYNPVSRLAKLRYRTMTFELTDKSNKKRTVTCRVDIRKDKTYMHAWDCNEDDGSKNGQKWKGFSFHRDYYKYGYNENSLIIDDVINNPASGSGNKGSQNTKTTQ